MNESFAGTWRAERLQVLALEARMSAAGCADEMRAALNKTAEQFERLAEHEVEAASATAKSNTKAGQGSTDVAANAHTLGREQQTEGGLKTTTTKTTVDVKKESA
jgi:hypothetical protein